jgi:hypothetical protein
MLCPGVNGLVGKAHILYGQLMAKTNFRDALKPACQSFKLSPPAMGFAFRIVWRVVGVFLFFHGIRFQYLG